MTATPPGVCVGGSSTLTATVAGPGAYCAATHTGGGGVNAISAVSINTLTASGLAAPAPDYYHFNDPTGTNTTTLTAGNTYSVNVDASATGTIVSVWFDWNQDGLYDASEWVQPYTSDITGSASVIVPANAMNGNTGMRVRSRTSGNTNGATDACTVFGSGTTEDFTITITGGVASGLTYSWSPATFLDGTTSSAVTANNVTTTTTYTVAVSNGTCTATGNVTLNTGPVAVVPTSVQTSSGAACSGSTFQLDAGLTGGGFPYTFVWAPSTGLSNSTIGNPVATVSSTTTYTVTVNDNCGSFASGMVTVTVSPLPAVTVTPSNPTICGGSSVSLTASGDPAT